MTGPTPYRLRSARRVLRAGGLIAYPTEAVWGLGCDPQSEPALVRLLAIKGRAAKKGFILVAAGPEQLEPFLAELSSGDRQRILATWPGPVTWILPVGAGVSPTLTGGRETVAVRVSDHPVVRALCTAWGGPLVSTSANLSAHPPVRRALDIRRVFGSAVDLIVPGELGGRARPSEIRNLAGAVVRAG